ncbi:hypothetical protein SmJEL517_g04113 [Synchytrium microbalum]|uniref:GOLD domain-containing protein n=1 Tax=Synchytrium microbalum TaxID=1806994 RepID=A0A507BZG8_9FUNG|nr:uncharacterized protein SmJEL517_g04113 [Synchytrium microbalum]TPX32822.1 hypothetical protein SmJEL517_g04113 [Synchytrium microbalum]
MAANHLTGLILCILISIVSSDDLMHPFSISMAPGASGECFYENITIGVQVTFLYEVASGEDFLIKATITGPPPSNQVIYDEGRLEDATYSFEVKEAGEHAFCFDNSVGESSYRDINFNIVLKIPPGVTPPEDHLYTSSNPHPSLNTFGPSNTTATGPPSALEAGIIILSDKLYTVTKLVDYYGLRLHRHRYIADSLNDRVQYWAVCKSAALIFWSWLSVLAIRRMFSDRGISV